MRLRVYMSVQAMYGAGNALYWNDSERQNSMHLTLLKHQNTKTSLYKLSKNHWVIAFFKKFGSVRKKLQFTVFLDHPVLKTDYSAKKGQQIFKCNDNGFTSAAQRNFFQLERSAAAKILSFVFSAFLEGPLKNKRARKMLLFTVLLCQCNCNGGVDEITNKLKSKSLTMSSRA